MERTMAVKTESATVKIGEAAAILGIGKQTAYNLANSGQLPGAIRLGKRWVVSRQSLDDLLAGRPR
jgi:excisionase family DNA binding protein